MPAFPTVDCSEQVSFFNAILILLTIPALNASIVMLLFDRLLRAHFFHIAVGGQPLLTSAAPPTSTAWTWPQARSTPRA